MKLIAPALSSKATVAVNLPAEKGIGVAAVAVEAAVAEAAAPAATVSACRIRWSSATSRRTWTAVRARS